MEIPAFTQIALLHMILLVPDVIAATAITEAAVAVIIKAAVAAIIEVAVAAITVHTIPEEAILTADTTEATQGGDPFRMAHPNHNHLDDTTADHNLAEDVDPSPTAGADLDHQEEGTAIIPILQITNVPSMPQSLPEGNDIEQIEAVKCIH